MTQPPPIASLTGVRLDRGGRPVLRDVDLAVPTGSVTAVLGPSGSGKSTLLAALTGELEPAAGTVEVFGQPLPRQRRALLETRKQIGVLLQGNGLLTDLTAGENIALPLRAHTRLPEPVLRRLVLLKLHAVGLRGAVDLVVVDVFSGAQTPAHVTTVGPQAVGFPGHSGGSAPDSHRLPCPPTLVRVILYVG